MRPRAAILAGAVLLGSGLSCGKRDEIVPTTLRWDPDVRPIVERSCLPCHSIRDTLKGPNAHGVNLETYERVRRERKDIFTTVVVERSMPGTTAVGISLSEEEIARIGAWLRGGAPR